MIRPLRNFQATDHFDLYLISLLLVLSLSCACSSTLTTLPVDPTPGATRTDSLGLAQVWVPAGCFQMGSDPTQDSQARADEQPAHQVCFTHGFWLDQFTITNAAFDVFVQAGGYQTDAYWSVDGLAWKRVSNVSGPDTNCRTLSGDPQEPRTCLKWYEAEAYANGRADEKTGDSPAVGPEVPISTMQTAY